MLGDNRGILVIMGIRCVEAYFTNSMEMVPLLVGLAILLMRKHKQAEKEWYRLNDFEIYTYLSFEGWDGNGNVLSDG